MSFLKRWYIFILIIFTVTGCSKSGDVSQSSVVVLTISSIVPASGPTNNSTAVTITGTGFTTSTVVTIGSQPCQNIFVDSSTMIHCIAPAESVGSVDVSVLINAAVAQLKNGFSYTPNILPVPGIVIASGGGIASGPGMQLHLTIGQTASSSVQKGPGISLFPGIQGIMLDAR